MKKGDIKFIVVWNNPRSIEKVTYLRTEKGFHRMEVIKNKAHHWRKGGAIFDTKKEVKAYLEIEDYRSIH